MQFSWRSILFGNLFTLTMLCLVGCGGDLNDSDTDPSTVPASPAAEDQPVTDAP